MAWPLEERNLYQSYANVTNNTADGKALKALEKTPTSYTKEWTTDQDIDAPSTKDPESAIKVNPTNPAIEAGKLEQGNQEWGPKGQPKASDQLKISEGSKWSQLSGTQKVAKGAQVLEQAINTLDMLTGGKDQLQMANNDLSIGSNWDPNMYIA